MKRIRLLLLKILRHLRDNGGNDGYATSPDFSPEYSKEQVDYHIHLCREAGLVRCTDVQCGNGELKTELVLTWQGHEYLDDNRD
ncbi:MAG: DUF2513 domain-containing protein [Proteobacteria bacterium]|nr:DUF2513 domain-containing protein [Pseudomonadota bacterium]